MYLKNVKRLVCSVLLILIVESECKGGGRSGGGGGRSGHSTGHSSGGHSSYGGGSHSSYGGSHSSYGGSHPATYGGSHTSSHGDGVGHYGSSGHASGYKPIGFDHVNQQAHNSINSRPGIGFDHVNSQAARPSYQYHPYKPQTVVHSGGYVQYHPPSQLQYSPPSPVTVHSSTHYVPVYQPTVIHTQSSSDHVGSFVGGYLVGRITSGGHSHSSHVTNNYYSSGNDDSTGNSYYTVHHYHHNRKNVPSRFSVPGEELSECQSTITDQLCVPNTNAFCLKNGTIMCTTPTALTTPCEQNSTERCVYSRIPCNPNLACNVTSNQTFIDFYLPCIANVTYVDNKIYDNNYITTGNYELCVTAIAHPRKLESPFASVVNLVSELAKWHLEKIVDIHNLSTPSATTTTT